MPFYKKAYNKQHEVYYPRAVVQGKPVETETIAKDLAKISTVSNSDVQAVLGDIAGVIHARMSQGKSVHIKGLGYFRYTLATTGVKNLEDFDFAKQVKAVRVEFIPEREKITSGTYSRALVDSEQLEWIEVNPVEEEIDKTIVFQVPEDLAEGKYRITLETYYSGSDTPLEEVKVIECPEVTLI